jgi:hypothetical protein
MSKTTIRAAAGLGVALSLAAFAWPAAADDDAPPSGDVVRAASVSEPVIVGSVDETAVRTPGALLTELSEAIAQDIAEARHAQHVEAVAIWQAAEAKAEAERLWIANAEAAEARRVEEARQAEEARRAEEQRAAATAPAGSLDAIIQRHFGSASSAAIRIAQCESGMNPRAVSPTDDHGLFQINIVHRSQFEAVTGAPWSSVYDAELNTIYARYLYGQQGWGPWTCA